VTTPASGRPLRWLLPGEQGQPIQCNGRLIGVRGRKNQPGPAIEFRIVQVAARVMLAQQTEQPFPVRIAGRSVRVSAQWDLPPGSAFSG
jgi:hypothetical protein